MTTPITNVLDIAQQPPYILGLQELDKFHRAITALYEQQPKADREAFLLDDCMSLILRHRMAKVEREGMAHNNPVRLFPNRSEKDLKTIQRSIEEIARLLLSVADSLNTRLPESVIEQCKNSTEESASRFYEIIREVYITPSWKTEKKADSSATGTGMGNNATTNPQTPPAAQKTAKLSILPPYTPKTKGRNAGIFANTIAIAYKDKADIIQEHTKNALENMTDPKAVIALFIVYFKKNILKQCPTYWQALRLLDIEADTDREKTKQCPFGSYQGYDRQRALFFAQGNRSLNEIGIEQDNDISSYIQAANNTYMTLLAKLDQPHEEQARQGA